MPADKNWFFNYVTRNMRAPDLIKKEDSRVKLIYPDTPRYRDLFDHQIAGVKRTAIWVSLNKKFELCETKSVYKKDFK